MVGACEGLTGAAPAPGWPSQLVVFRCCAAPAVKGNLEVLRNTICRYYYWYKPRPGR